VHFLWLAALPLLLGFRWAICSATITLLGVTAFGKEPLTMLGVNFLLGVLAPISLTYACYTLMVRILPRNRFVYVLCGAFIPGALALGLKMLSLSAYYYVDDIFAWSTISDKYLMLTSLLMMPEAMFNAMTVLLLVLYKPQWLYTYHHKMYLGK
jgi:uncharacterized membrane protein